MATHRFLALLRGVNVGGNGKVSMAELKAAMITACFENVSTYINSGNVIFTSSNTDTEQLATDIARIIHDQFSLNVDVVVVSEDEWREVIANAPRWWGHDTTRKHNLIVLLKPYDIHAVMEAIGTLKPDIESAEPGNGVIYQSLSLTDFGKTTSGKLASKPMYKRMTIRNYNTATKLLALLD